MLFESGGPCLGCALSCLTAVACSQTPYIQVHKFLLARDASAFQDMFSIPSDAEADSGPSREGRSDANPIVLYGETEDEFRILLSALYAL